MMESYWDLDRLLELEPFEIGEEAMECKPETEETPIESCEQKYSTVSSNSIAIPTIRRQHQYLGIQTPPDDEHTSYGHTQQYRDPTERPEALVDEADHNMFGGNMSLPNDSYLINAGDSLSDIELSRGLNWDTSVFTSPDSIPIEDSPLKKNSLPVQSAQVTHASDIDQHVYEGEPQYHVSDSYHTHPQSVSKAAWNLPQSDNQEDFSRSLTSVAAHSAHIHSDLELVYAPPPSSVVLLSPELVLPLSPESGSIQMSNLSLSSPVKVESSVIPCIVSCREAAVSPSDSTCGLCGQVCRPSDVLGSTTTGIGVFDPLVHDVNNPPLPYLGLTAEYEEKFDMAYEVIGRDNMVWNEASLDTPQQCVKVEPELPKSVTHRASRRNEMKAGQAAAECFVSLLLADQHNHILSWRDYKKRIFLVHENRTQELTDIWVKSCECRNFKNTWGNLTARIRYSIAKREGFFEKFYDTGDSGGLPKKRMFRFGKKMESYFPS